MNKTFFLLFTFLSIFLHSQKKDFEKEILATPILQNSSFAFYAADCESGKDIITINENMRLAPASNLKVITSGVALNLLGKDFRFVTKLAHNGKINAGILNGDLFIIGGGDPTFGSTQVANSLSLEKRMEEIFSELQKLGVKKIDGNIFGVDDIFEQQSTPDYWPWIDIGNYYGAAPSGLSIHDNLYYLFFKPGTDVGDSATVLRTEPQIENLFFINEMKTGKKGSGDNGYIYRAPRSSVAFLQGTIPAGVEEFSIKGSMFDPPLFAATYLKSFLVKKGIEVGGEAKSITKLYGKPETILEMKSPALSEIVFIVNKKSNNHYTEQLLNFLGYKFGANGGRDEGIKVIENHLKEKRIDIQSLELYDGSGLSRTNQISPKIISSFLNKMSSEKEFEAYYNSFPIAGDTNDAGGFKRFGLGTKLEKNARIKSGTISGVRAFSGYVKSKTNRLISFSFIVNNYAGKRSDVDDLYKKILLYLAEMK